MQFLKRVPSAEHRSEVFLMLLLGLALSGFVLLRMYAGINFDLGKTRQLYLSQATAEGIDIAARTHFYRNSLVIGSILVVLNYLLLRFLSGKFNIKFSRYADLPTLAVALIATVFLGSMGVSVKLTSELLTSMIVLRIAGLVLKPLVSPDLLLNEFGLNVALALTVLAGTWFVIGGASFAANIVLWFTLIYLAVLLLRYVLAKLLRPTTSSVALPYVFFSVPWCIFFASEYSFWRFERFGKISSPVPVFFLLLILFGIVFYFLVVRKPGSSRRQKRLTRWAVVSVLFLFTLITCYQPIISDTVDLFETANSANAVMRVFRFHEIPMVDFMSSHMLSEQWYGYLYSLVFGYRTNLEFLVYGFLNDFIYLWAAYIFLAKIFKNPWTTLFVVCFLPVLNETLFPPIFFSVLGFLAIIRAFQSPSVKNYLLAFLVVTGLILWRIDTGVVAVTAGSCLFVLLWLLLKQRMWWRQFFIAAGIFAACLFTGLIVAVLIAGREQISERLILFLRYISAEQAHGYAAMGHTTAHQFFTVHVLMPATAVVAILYMIYLLRQIPRSKIFSSGYIPLSSLFLFLVFLFNAPRGLVRHGFAENTERFFWSTFIPALALLILHFVRRSNRRYLSAAWFSAVFLLFMCLKYFPWIPREAYFENGVRKAGIFHMKWWSQEPALMAHRFAKNDSIAAASSGELKARINTILRPDQTFFDFSNAPLLYFFTGRYVPGFFCQNLQNTVDDEMQLGLMKELSVEKVPVVVYSAVPPTWYDATDGIHNTVRYYLLAEYIHSRYHYFCTESGRAIWLSNRLSNTYPSSKYPYAPSQLTLGFLPAYTASAVTGNPRTFPLKAMGVYAVSGGEVLTLPRSIRMSNHIWLSAEFGDHPPGAHSLELISSAGDTLAMNFSLKEDSKKYFFRLTNNYIWWLPGEMQVRIPEGSEIQSLTFYRDERFEDQE